MAIFMVVIQHHSTINYNFSRDVNHHVTKLYQTMTVYDHDSQGSQSGLVSK